MVGTKRLLPASRGAESSLERCELRETINGFSYVFRFPFLLFSKIFRPPKILILERTCSNCIHFFQIRITGYVTLSFNLIPPTYIWYLVKRRLGLGLGMKKWRIRKINISPERKLRGSRPVAAGTIGRDPWEEEEAIARI